MPCLARWVSACTLVGLIFGGGDARAQSVVLESAELGTTGRIGGTSISTAQYVGWRFQVAEPLMVERVGGHLLTYPDVPGEIFAALVRLSVIDAFPQGSPFTAEEVVATTLFRPDFPSDEILTPLSAELDPGSYALVFGTGLFGATGEGAIHNGPDQPDIPPTELSSFIFFGIPNIGQPQIWRTNLASNMRFVIEANRQGDFDFDGNVDGRDVLTWQRNPSVGDLADWQSNYGVGAIAGLSSSVVPEPATWLLLVSGALLFGDSSRLCARRSH